MSAKTMTKNNRWKSQKIHSTHVHSSLWEADDSSKRDYDGPIHSQNVILDNYDCYNDQKNDKFKEGDILVVKDG